MMFANDIVLCSTRREEAWEWRRAREERGLKISWKKTEYLMCNEHEDADFHYHGEAVKRVTPICEIATMLN